jgi:hypothetical protein
VGRFSSFLNFSFNFLFCFAWPYGLEGEGTFSTLRGYMLDWLVD